MAVKDTYFFSHDYNARLQKGMPALLMKHGMLGYGVYWALKELLFNNQNNLDEDYDVLAYDLRVAVEVVKSVVCDFGFFTVTDGCITMDDVQEQLEERLNRSNKARESIAKRWESARESSTSVVEKGGERSTTVKRRNNDGNTNVLRQEYDTNTLKERKGKEKKDTLPERESRGLAPHPAPADASPEMARNWEAFQKFLIDYAPSVLRMREPFTYQQFDRIFHEFDQKLIRNVLMSMHNKPSLVKDYVSANLTFRNWAQRRLDDVPPQSPGTAMPPVNAQAAEMQALIAQKRASAETKVS